MLLELRTSLWSLVCRILGWYIVQFKDAVSHFSYQQQPFFPKNCSFKYMFVFFSMIRLSWIWHNEWHVTISAQGSCRQTCSSECTCRTRSPRALPLRPAMTMVSIAIESPSTVCSAFMWLCHVTSGQPALFGVAENHESIKLKVFIRMYTL